MKNNNRVTRFALRVAGKKRIEQRAERIEQDIAQWKVQVNQKGSRKLTSIQPDFRHPKSVFSHLALISKCALSVTRNPQPVTRNPQLETRNPQPTTRNPKPVTRNPQPATRNP